VFIVSIPDFPRKFFGADDVLLLRRLVAANEQNIHSQAVLHEIYSVA
jgi:hypothetical protein